MPKTTTIAVAVVVSVIVVGAVSLGLWGDNGAVDGLKEFLVVILPITIGQLFLSRQNNELRSQGDSLKSQNDEIIAQNGELHTAVNGALDAKLNEALTVALEPLRNDLAALQESVSEHHNAVNLHPTETTKEI